MATLIAVLFLIAPSPEAQAQAQAPRCEEDARGNVVCEFRDLAGNLMATSSCDLKTPGRRVCDNVALETNLKWRSTCDDDLKTMRSVCVNTDSAGKVTGKEICYQKDGNNVCDTTDPNDVLLFSIICAPDGSCKRQN
jgi:hypothetical protein